MQNRIITSDVDLSQRQYHRRAQQPSESLQIDNQYTDVADMQNSK